MRKKVSRTFSIRKEVDAELDKFDFDWNEFISDALEVKMEQMKKGDFSKNYNSISKESLIRMKDLIETMLKRWKYEKPPRE